MRPLLLAPGSPGGWAGPPLLGHQGNVQREENVGGGLCPGPAGGPTQPPRGADVRVSGGEPLEGSGCPAMVASRREARGEARGCRLPASRGGRARGGQDVGSKPAAAHLTEEQAPRFLTSGPSTTRTRRGTPESHRRFQT